MVGRSGDHALYANSRQYPPDRHLPPAQSAKETTSSKAQVEMAALAYVWEVTLSWTVVVNRCIGWAVERR